MNSRGNGNVGRERVKSVLQEREKTLSKICSMRTEARESKRIRIKSAVIESGSGQPRRGSNEYKSVKIQWVSNWRAFGYICKYSELLLARSAVFVWEVCLVRLLLLLLQALGGRIRPRSCCTRRQNVGY